MYTCLAAIVFFLISTAFVKFTPKKKGIKLLRKISIIAKPLDFLISMGLLILSVMLIIGSKLDGRHGIFHNVTLEDEFPLSLISNFYLASDIAFYICLLLSIVSITFAICEKDKKRRK